MKRESTPRIQVAMRDGMVGGLVAGTVFAIIETTFAALHEAPELPWRAAASLIAGPGVFSRPFSFGVFVMGLIVHGALSVLFGALWSLVASRRSPEFRDHLGTETVLAMTFAGVLAFVNLGLIARVAFPWLLGLANVYLQLFLHMFAYGLPLGAYLYRCWGLHRPLEMHHHPRHA